MNKIPTAPTGKKIRILEPGDVFHLVDRPVMIRMTGGWNGTRVVERGETVEVTAEMVALAHEREDSWFDLIADPDGQIARWGALRFEEGPATGPAWDHGDARYEMEKREALAVVRSITDPSERARAFAEVKQRFARPEAPRVLLGAGTDG